MKTLNKTLKALLASAALIATASVSAAPITGTVNFSLGSVLVSAGEIDWNGFTPGTNINIGPAPIGSPTYGESLASGLNTGSFATIPFLSTVRVQDMSANNTDGNYISLGNQPTAISNFLFFAAQPNWKFDLTYLSPGTDVDGAGPLPQAPYGLEERDGNVLASFIARGTATDLGANGLLDATDSVTNWTGVFSTQYTNTSINKLILDIQGNLEGDTTPGYLPNNSWSATVTAEIPEPSSVALLGLGLLGVAGLRRRKQA